MSNVQIEINDAAKGPLAGYLFQFEKALLLLASLENSTDYVTVEEVDDVATHSEEGTVILTVQAKHSIASSGTTFEDTSSSLWRTLQIWIEKLERGVFTKKTHFTCSTNKKIPETSLLYRIKNNPLIDVIQEIEELLHLQDDKLKEKVSKDPKSGGSIKQTIKLIKYVLGKKSSFEIVKENIQIEDNEVVREKFLNKIHVGSDKIRELQKENIYESFYGWVTYASKAKWNNDAEAKFTKKNFDDKWLLIRTNPSIISAVFRTKESLGTIGDAEILDKKKELFVKQLEDIERRKDAKERIIKNAVLDFIYSDIELKHVIDKGDFTDQDFEQFLDECAEVWQTTFDQKVLGELENYSAKEKNDLAIDVFDTIMHKIKLEFKEGFCFTTSNQYMRNGCFLKLSNVPTIGWHPEWESKYKADEK